MPLKIGARGTIDRIEWDAGSGMQHVLYSDVQGNPGSGQHPQRMQDAVNKALTFRQLLSSLPIEDPDRTTDPDRGRLFWGDLDGKKTLLEPFDRTYLVSRAVTVTVDHWDGEKYICTTRRV